MILPKSFFLRAAICLMVFTAAAQATPITTGLVLHLDAADNATILDAEGDAAGSAGFSGSVSTWSDKSGLAHHADAGTSAPGYTATGLNGLPALSFTAAQLLNGPANDLILSAADAARTVYAVLAVTSPGNTEIFDFNRGGTGTRHLYRITPEVGLRNGGGNTIWGNDTLGSTAQILAMETPGGAGMTTGNTLAYVNNDTALTQTESTNDTLLMNTGSTGYRIAGASFAGQISELLVYEDVHTPAQINEVGFYLQNKWDVAAATFIPEPSTFALFGLGVLVLCLRRRG
jgi:hypothetical protein